MIRTNYSFFCLIVSLLFVSASTFAQTGNFDETWKEFLQNDKISNMSELIVPEKAYDKPNYAKYLLMNTNSCLCQSNMNDAERLLAELKEMDTKVHSSIPGFVAKMNDISTKIDAYYSVDAIWKRFLETQEVDQKALEAIEATKTICEKKTLAKYSYMTAYANFCKGDILKSRDIFENRTLRLTEKTTLRVEDVEGLAEEVTKMKSLYRDMTQLDNAWQSYIKTGVSPGFDIELPLFRCNPIPNMKALVLRGAVDVCRSGPPMFDKIKQLQAETGVAPDRELAGKVKELEAAIAQKDAELTALNVAWEAFIPDNKVKHFGQYAYEYCSKEPLIRAYIMDGFAYTCELAEEMLRKIDSLQADERTPLAEITMVKINELAALNSKNQKNAMEVDRLWRKFIAQGNTISDIFQPADYYCDNIHQVKYWTMKGLSGSCEDGNLYLTQIEDFQRTFEFLFAEELECRVQILRVKVWECRHQALLKLAQIEAPDNPQERLKELMEEYGVGERPADCAR